MASNHVRRTHTNHPSSAGGERKRAPRLGQRTHTKHPSLCQSASTGPLLLQLCSPSISLGNPSWLCGGKTSLESKNSSNIHYVTFLVYFHTIASQNRCEIMNSEVPGSILTVFPVKRNKAFFSRSRTCKTQPLKNNDENNTIIASHSNTEKSYWEICQV